MYEVENRRRRAIPSYLERVLPPAALVLAALVGVIGYLNINQFSQVNLFLLLQLSAVLLAVGGFFYSRARSPLLTDQLLVEAPGPSADRIWRLMFSGLVVLIGILGFSLYGSTFYRDISYHITSTVVVALVCVQIAIVKPFTRFHAVGTMFIVLCLGFINRSGLFLLNLVPGWYDGVFHQDAATAVASTGQIPATLGPYADFPLYHIRNAQLILVGHLDPLATIGIVNLIALLIPVSGYLIVTHIFHDRRLGVFAALIMLITPLMHLAVASPHVTALSLVLLATFLVVKSHSSTRNTQMMGIVLFLGVAAMLEHPTFGALTLALVLLADASIRLLYPNTRIKTHVLTYAIVVVGYLFFAAARTFEWSVIRLLSAQVPGPPFALTPPSPGLAYTAHLVVAYLPFAIITLLFLLAALRIVMGRGKPLSDLLVLIPIFIVVPALAQLAFGRPIAQLLPLAIYPVFGALAVPVLLRLRPSGVVVVALVVTLGFSQLSLSLANDGNLYLFKPEAPQVVTHASESTRQLRAFIDRLPAGERLILDYSSGWAHWGTAHFTSSGPAEVISLENFNSGSAFVVYNPPFILRWQGEGSDPRGLVLAVVEYLEISPTDIIYNSGPIIVYHNS